MTLLSHVKGHGGSSCPSASNPIYYFKANCFLLPVVLSVPPIFGVNWRQKPPYGPELEQKNLPPSCACCVAFGWVTGLVKADAVCLGKHCVFF